MKNTFVETSNVKRFLSALSALEDRGAQEACLAVVDGEPGLGKTTTLKNWVAQSGWVYLRAKKEWKSGWMMNELLEALPVKPPYSIEKKYETILRELGSRHSAALMSKRTFGLVIDEADHISTKEALLETVRDISDMLEMPVILVGMGKINDNISRFPQISSRISQRVKFQKASREDIRLLIDRKCEVKVADCLVDFVLKVSQGFNREVLEAIANIEKFGLRADPGPAGVTMADMAGLKVLSDRRTSKPLHVPEFA